MVIQPTINVDLSQSIQVPARKLLLHPETWGLKHLDLQICRVQLRAFPCVCVVNHKPNKEAYIHFKSNNLPSGNLT